MKGDRGREGEIFREKLLLPPPFFLSFFIIFFLSVQFIYFNNFFTQKNLVHFCKMNLQKWDILKTKTAAVSASKVSESIII